MPWRIQRGAGCPDSRPFAVVKEADGSVEGCHPTRSAAERQQRALYASEGSTTIDSIEKLNAAIFAASEMLFEVHEDDLTAIYEEVILRAAHGAVNRFVREAGSHPPDTAAFNEPHISENYGPISKAAAERIRRLQHSIALDYYEMVSAKAQAPFPEAEFLDQLSKRAIVDIDERVRDELQAIVSDAVANDRSISATANQMFAKFGEIAQPTARMIAQTQITTLSNAMGLQAAHEVQKKRRKQMFKTWTTQGDAKVRIAHAQSNGQTVPLDQAFQVGGYLMMFPGDPGAPLKLTANCRCFLQYTEALVASASPGILAAREGAPMPEIGEATIRVTPVLDWSNIQMTVHPEGGFTWWPPEAAPETATTITVSDDAPAPAQDAVEQHWQGIITMEGMSTGDGRYFAEDAWSWRELPLTMYAQLAIDDGHDGAQVAGRIDRIWKIPAADAGVEGAPAGAMAVMGEGMFDSGEFGQEVARMVKEQTLRGISVDFGVSKAGLWDTEEMKLVEDTTSLDPAEVLFGNRYERAAIEAEIGAATVVGHPAFADANIALIASGHEATQVWLTSAVLTASGAGMAPVKPPREWFDDPQLEFPTPLTITDEGQVFGHIALWGTCHTGLPGCEQPPHSATGYRFFHLGACPVEDGGLVPCGKLTFNTGHAPVSYPTQRALAHYDNSGTVAAHVCAGEDIHGIWISGAINPDLDANKIRIIQGSTPSGDWRSVNGYYREMVAVLCANMPGFPVPRTEAHVALTASGEAEVVAVIAAGVPVWATVHPRSRSEQRQIRVLSDEFAAEIVEAMSKSTWDWEPEGLRTFSAEERRRMAENGQAMPDGSYPIPDCSSASDAIHSIGRAPAGKRSAVRAHIRKRVRALGCSGSTFENFS